MHTKLVIRSVIDSFLDSNGILQSVHYVSDPVNGFRVAATNLPEDLPEVAYAKAKHFADYHAIAAEHAAIGAQRTVEYSNPVVYSIDSVAQVSPQLLSNTNTSSI